MPDGNLNGSSTGGGRYCGCYDLYGRRHGFGAEKWGTQEQKYEGTFVRDAFHGEGAYEWFTGKERLIFDGHFYSNFKEGYGLVSLPDGSVFEGLFCNNRPLGPGVKTHANGRQDVGFWCGNRIVRLSRSVDCIIPRLASTSAGKLKLLQFQTIMPFVEKDADVGAALLMKHGLDPSESSRLYSNLIHDPRSMFFDRPHLDKVYFAKVSEFDSNSESPEASNRCGVSSPEDDPSCKRPRSSTNDDKISYVPLEVREGKSPADRLRFYSTENLLNGSSTALPRDATTNTASSKNTLKLKIADADAGTECGTTQLLSWNRSELCMDMLKQIFRFRSFEEKLTFRISDLMVGARTKFRKTGETERVCLHFLKMCSIGPAYAIKDLLCSKNISEALMDARGNNSIMFAVATDQNEVIELLLNYGADVNSFNDENLTPLNFCLLRRVAESASLGNWELSFLAPDHSVPGGVKTKTWRAVESIASLDRIFGDGMSAYDSETFHEMRELSEQDSVFCFDDGDDDSQDLSSVTLLRYKGNDEVPASERSMSHGAGNRDGTVKLGKTTCPMSFKREEYLRSVAHPTEQDKYFFQLNVDKSRQHGEEASYEDAVGVTIPSEALNEQTQKNFNNRIFKIDRTIDQLLRRGADPNLGDAPKPSLHLAVYSEELNLVRLLLAYGAAPDSHSLPQEGLLTPLHVLVLMKPGKVKVDMCKLLLNYGASPEEETAPDFTPYGESDFLLDPDHGRTPLQLLCTRRDAEDVDQEGFLTQLALLLVRVSAVGHFFRGHSYLTLAMISGNYAIVEALLTSKRVDPNELLGGNLGTALHVLVSTELQKRTLLENSIRMCDLLLARGANPNLIFRTPRSLAGTCIDFGYREIEMASNGGPANDPAAIKLETRNYLEDHLRVVEYLAKRSKRDDEKGKKQNVKIRYGIQTKETKTRGSGSAKEGDGDGASGEGTTRTGEKEEETGEERETEGEDLRRNERNKRALEGARGSGEVKNGNQTKIIEIKKHVEKGTMRKQGGGKDAAGKASKKKVGRSDGKYGAGKKEGISGMENVRRTDAHGSERLPERFRQSLLHMFGICGETLHLNDFLLPYVVLRNGDLYYRFKGRKPAGTEQYSLI